MLTELVQSSAAVDGSEFCLMNSKKTTGQDSVPFYMFSIDFSLDQAFYWKSELMVYTDTLELYSRHASKILVNRGTKQAVN